jgi:histidinol-phosphatase (PHP family)
MITVNNHIHSEYSQDGEATIKDIIKKAKECGLKVITITDHFPTQEYSKIDVPAGNMNAEDVGDYLKVKSGEIDLRIGFEIDYAEGFDLEIPDIDFALGAVHAIDGVCFDYSEENFINATKKLGGVKNLYLKYFRLIQEMIKIEKFDCVAHLDLVKKFNKDDKYFSEDEEEYRNAVLETLELVKEKNIVMEINTSGLFKPIGDQYPSRWIIEKAFKRGIEVSVGSDSHKPEAVCQGFELVGKMLKEIGYDNVCTFKKRKKEYVPI